MKINFTTFIAIKNRFHLSDFKRLFRSKILRISLVLFLIVFNIPKSYSQGDWLEYLITKEKKLMTIQVDMEFDSNRPNYKNLLIVGSGFKGCLKNGFPNEEGLKELYAFSDSTEFVLNKITKTKLVGVVTYRCIGLDIYYIKDTINIRKNLQNLYSREFKERTQRYIYIQKDNNRKYYYENLFPKNLSSDFFLDQEYLIELAKSGDKLDDKRKVTHWAYFRTTKKREKFVKNIKALDYQIDSVYISKKDKYPYQLQFSQESQVDPESIFEITNLIKVLANSSNSIYGGWGFDPKTDDTSRINN